MSSRPVQFSVAVNYHSIIIHLNPYSHLTELLLQGGRTVTFFVRQPIYSLNLCFALAIRSKCYKWWKKIRTISSVKVKSLHVAGMKFYSFCFNSKTCVCITQCFHDGFISLW